MTVSGREVIDVLEKFVQLEWYRFTRVGHGGMNTIPITVWRFANPPEVMGHEEVIQLLREGLVEVATNIPWTIKLSGRNWVLLPTCVHELENSGLFRTDGEIHDFLGANEPGLFEEACKDFAELSQVFFQKLDAKK
jgi:hypothetical protein